MLLSPCLSLASLLFGFPFSQAIRLYLHPQQHTEYQTLSPHHASFALSRHLRLEAFEPFHNAVAADYSPEDFVAQGPSKMLLVTMDDADTKVIVPSSFRPSFEITHPMPGFDVPSLISTYLHRAQYSYASIYSKSSGQPHDVASLSTFFQSAEAPSFAAVDFRNLSDLRLRHGSTDEAYIKGAHEIRLFLQRAFEGTDDLHIALLAYPHPPSPMHTKRETQPSQSPLPPPQEPIGSIATCFQSAVACYNSTNLCSGRGQCLEATKSGRTCYVCVCGVTKTGEGSKVKTDSWVGQSCEKKDISGPFTLLTGTVVVLIVLLSTSIYLLLSIGNNELPSMLLATAVNTKKE